MSLHPESDNKTDMKCLCKCVFTVVVVVVVVYYARCEKVIAWGVQHVVEHIRCVHKVSHIECNSLPH